MRPPARSAVRWGGVALLVLAVLVVYQYANLGQWLSLDALKDGRNMLLATRAEYPVASAMVFFLGYVLATALSIPGAFVLTLAAGAVFGLATGLLLVSFASSLGALLAFLLARTLLRDLVQARFGQRLRLVNQGMERDGALYLLTLRLVPIFPFWLINVVMGLTRIRAGQFYWVSQIGMLPGTAVYVNAGTQLAAIETMADILSPALWLSLALLAAFPWLARFGVARWQRHKIYARWPRPRRFDRNLVVIGAGAGGLVSAYIAAAAKAKVTLVEAQQMGGDCLNSGCVPSKALIRSAKIASLARQGSTYGIHAEGVRVDFAAVMERIQQVIRDIAPHDSIARYTDLGVEVLQGHARLTSPWTVLVTSPEGSQTTLTTRSVILACGARPRIPSIPGLSEVGCLTSDTVWALRELPARLVILGGGPVGCEMAQSFARLGSAVTLVEAAPRLLMREDPEVGDWVAEALCADGVTVLTGHEAMAVEGTQGGKQLQIAQDGQSRALPFDQLLCAVGREPRVQGYGLEELGVALRANQTIATNAYLQTTYPNIYAVGDVTGPLQLTHAAAHQAWHAAVNALFGRFRRFKVDAGTIPWTIFTDPEVARVGLSETEARARGIAYELTRYDLGDLDRAIADGTARGFIKVLTVPGKDRLLGVTLVGEHAGDLLAEYVLAMKHDLGLKKILGTTHSYPTLAEANKAVAGEWQRAHLPTRALIWLRRFHTWDRS